MSLWCPTSLCLTPALFLILFIYFERERQRQRERNRERDTQRERERERERENAWERGRKRESLAGCTLSAQTLMWGSNS